MRVNAAWIANVARKHVIWTCIAASLLFIISVVGGCLYANSQVIDASTVDFEHRGIGTHQTLAGTLVRYDAVHFTGIAQKGYRDSNNLAFLPLYIVAIRLVALSGVSYSLAAMIVSWLALCSAAAVMYYWVQFELQASKRHFSPWVVLGLLATFPTALFFALPYTESLFLLLNVGALLCFRKGYYVSATVLAGLVAMTRYQGIVLAVFFLADYYCNRQDRTFKKLLPIVGSAAGIGTYMAFLTIKFGSPLAFITAEKQWGRLTGNPIISLMTSLSPIMLWFIIVAIGGLVLIKRYLGWAYFIYSLAFMILPLTSGVFYSFNRYLLCLAPLMLALSIWYTDARTPAIARWLYSVSSCVLLGFGIILFANGYWVG